VAVTAFAEDSDFSGKWKGQSHTAAPPAGGPGAGAPATGKGPSAQKVTLNLKQAKDGKLSGNITFGEGNADDVKDGKAVNGKISFIAGRSPQPVYSYTGELMGDELILTRSAPAGTRGANPMEFVLSRK
jgi:hypothetical protein